MREDLILRYLKTSVERLGLAQRHLEEELDLRIGLSTKEDNRIAKEWHPAYSVDFYEIVKSYLDNLSSQTELLYRLTETLEKEPQSE